MSIESSDWRAWDPISPTTCTDARVAHGMTRPRRGHAGAVWRSIHLGRTPCNAAPSPEGILVVPARFVAQTLEKVPIVVTIVRAAATLLFSGCVAFCRFFQHPLLPLLRCRKRYIATISDHRAPSVHTSDFGRDNRFFSGAAAYTHPMTPPDEARRSLGHLHPPTRRRLRMCSAMHLFARGRHFCRCYAAAENLL